MGVRDAAGVSRDTCASAGVPTTVMRAAAMANEVTRAFIRAFYRSRSSSIDSKGSNATPSRKLTVRTLSASVWDGTGGLARALMNSLKGYWPTLPALEGGLGNDQAGKGVAGAQTAVRRRFGASSIRGIDRSRDWYAAAAARWSTG